MPATADGATTFGADLTQTPAFSSTQLSITNVIAPGGGTSVGSPVSGVLVSVSVRTQGDGGTGTVRVLRPAGNPDPSTYTFVNRAEVPVPFTADGTPAGHVTSVATRIPISAGDQLGWVLPGDALGNVYEMYNDGTSQCAFTGPTHLVGNSGDYSTVGCNNMVMILAGSVEADADGDGYGDETQDMCPTDASTQGPCPLAPPQVDDVRPRTTITAKPAKRTKSRKASLAFSADEPAVFECSLDGAAFTGCSSPKKYRRLSRGRHRFDVRAIDAAGNTGESVGVSWRVKKPRR